MNSSIRSLLTELKTELIRVYGPLLRGVYLFGSYARGQQHAESDVDVLIVLDDFTSYGDQIDRTSEIASRLSLRHGVSLSRVFAREREWRDGKTAFLTGVREEAVAA